MENKPLTNQQQQALNLFIAGTNTQTIAAQLVVTPRCVQKWVKDFDWSKLANKQPVLTPQQRLSSLLAIEEKTDKQFRELDLLLKYVYTPKSSSHTQDVQDNGKGKKRGRKPNKVKNDISLITDEAWTKSDQQFFSYQLHLNDIKDNPDTFRNRIIVKSRQIGLTYYFAYEAFRDACQNSDNQIFLSASKAQSDIFKSYIKQFAWEMGELELKGRDQIDLSNGASLYFLSTNSHTAQGYHGHLYVDEFFWIPQFKKLKKLASGMAMHKKWRRTYFSTPSSKSHDGYGFWTGADTKKDIDVSHKALKYGKKCEDGMYRQIITIDDAIAGGADFFDIKQLKQEYSKAEYNNLLLCKFTDDSDSVIPMQQLLACMVDAHEAWQDVDFNSNNPVGNQPVWIGYDPSAGGDESSVLVLLPPAQAGGIFRCIERHRWRGTSFASQADQLEELCQRFNVGEIAIDSTGIGYGIVELVREFFPAVHEIKYSITIKERLVHKAKDVIASSRLQFDASWKDMVQSFLMIKQSTTSLGKPTFTAQRSEANGHADLAFALMHALHLEPVDYQHDRSSTIFFG